MPDSTTQIKGPTTEAGRRLFTDTEPMDLWESDGVTWDDILAIEAEAAAAERAAIRAAVEVALDGIYSDACTDVLAILDAREP